MEGPPEVEWVDEICIDEIHKHTTTMTVSIILEQLKTWDANFTVGNFSGKPGFYHKLYGVYVYRQKLKDRQVWARLLAL